MERGDAVEFLEGTLLNLKFDECFVLGSGPTSNLFSVCDYNNPCQTCLEWRKAASPSHPAYWAPEDADWKRYCTWFRKRAERH